MELLYKGRLTTLYTFWQRSRIGSASGFRARHRTRTRQSSITVEPVPAPGARGGRRAAGASAGPASAASRFVIDRLATDRSASVVETASFGSAATYEVRRERNVEFIPLHVTVR